MGSDITPSAGKRWSDPAAPEREAGEGIRTAGEGAAAEAVKAGAAGAAGATGAQELDTLVGMVTVYPGLMSGNIVSKVGTFEDGTLEGKLSPPATATDATPPFSGQRG
jgi:hypothetical protein